MGDGFPATKVMLERAANAHQNTLKAHLKEFSEEGAVAAPIFSSGKDLKIQVKLGGKRSSE